METFIGLVSYTGEGVQHMDESPDRLDDARDVVESMGQYDAVAIMELPDAETAAQAGITISGAAAVRTETLRAFPEAEYRELIGGLA
jgi:uncharacterized protein with GYD domain